MKIFVRKVPGGSITSLSVESKERISSVKRKLKEKEGIRNDLHLGLMYNGKLLEDGNTLAHYNILKKSTLCLFWSEHALVENWSISVKTWSEKTLSLKVTSGDTIDDVKAKIEKNEGIPPHKQLLFYFNKWLEDGSLTLSNYGLHNYSTLHLAIQFEQGFQSPNVMFKEHLHPLPATQSHTIYDTKDGKARELEELKREMATARSKEKELEATISRLKDENKKTEQELTIARLEATIFGLTQNKKLLSAQSDFYESQVIFLKAQNKETEQELRVARNKWKEELEATICGLSHKNEVFSEHCASYESQVVALEVENKKIKEELMNADKILSSS